MQELDKIRKQLEERLALLTERVREIEGDLRTAPSADFEERATETEGDEVLQGLEGSALVEAQNIRNALKRIDEGVYGECVACGEPIGEKRLRALPYATLCINCAK